MTQNDSQGHKNIIEANYTLRLDRKWTNIIIWPRDRAIISVQQLRLINKNNKYDRASIGCSCLG
jgi:hypothetical protein